MSSFVTTLVVASQLSLLSAVAEAAPAPHANRASEAFAGVASTSLTVACPAPAKDVGSTIGDPEDDMLAGSIVIDPEIQPAFGSRGARELQSIQIVETGLNQPALGTQGARELQGYVARLTQLADGARGARELQLPMLALLPPTLNQCG